MSKFPVGARVRMTDEVKAALIANDYADYVAVFGGCDGVVIDVIDEDCVDVHWHPSGLRYLHGQNELEIML